MEIANFMWSVTWLMWLRVIKIIKLSALTMYCQTLVPFVSKTKWEEKRKCLSRPFRVQAGS